MTELKLTEDDLFFGGRGKIFFIPPLGESGNGEEMKDDMFQ